MTDIFTERPPAKGEYKGQCNREACKTGGACYYNHSTHAYYCTLCAMSINYYNKADAMRLYGHDLCTIGEHKI